MSIDINNLGVGGTVNATTLMSATPVIKSTLDNLGPVDLNKFKTDKSLLGLGGKIDNNWKPPTPIIPDPGKQSWFDKNFGWIALGVLLIPLLISLFKKKDNDKAKKTENNKSDEEPKKTKAEDVKATESVEATPEPEQVEKEHLITSSFGFKNDNNQLTDEQKNEFKVLAEEIKKSGKEIVIFAGASAIGSDKRNKELAEKRALAARDELIKNGVDPKLIKLSYDGAKGALYPASKDVNGPGKDDRNVTIVFAGTEKNVENLVEGYKKIKSEGLISEKTYNDKTQAYKQAVANSDTSTLENLNDAQKNLLNYNLGKDVVAANTVNFLASNSQPLANSEFNKKIADTINSKAEEIGKITGENVPKVTVQGENKILNQGNTQTNPENTVTTTKETVVGKNVQNNNVSNDLEKGNALRQQTAQQNSMQKQANKVMDTTAKNAITDGSKLGKNNDNSLNAKNTSNNNAGKVNEKIQVNKDFRLEKSDVAGKTTEKTIATETTTKTTGITR